MAPFDERVSLASLRARRNITNFDPIGILARDHDDDARVQTEGSLISEWMAGRAVLVTGATGFVGKMLVEKILRGCPRVDTVYILCRDKKGKDMHSRVEDVYNDEVFKKLSRQQPKFINKIVAIKGDISTPDLGMSIEDRKKIIDNVSVIYHVAATVNFDEKLKQAVDINVRGAAEMIKLARACPKLQSYVHVSSTYANCTIRTVEEAVYEPPIDPTELINIVDQTEPKDLDDITKTLLRDFPNTYSYTKCVAEKLVEQMSEGLPICIFRPAIVISSYKEPLRGWTDNMYGPTGVFTGAGLGIIRTLHCDGDKLADLVPVDYVVNCIIAASYKNSKEKNDRLKVYNYVSSTQKPIRWSEICAFVQYYGLQTPTVQAMWYLSFALNKYRFVNWLYVIFLHWLPALVVDGACILVGKQPRLLKLYKKIHKFMNVISYYAIKEWLFTNNNVQNLWTSLGKVDREAFPFSMQELDWDEHSQAHCLGLRKYLLKDDLSTLPEAKRRWKKLYYIHRSIQVITGMILFKLSYGLISSFT